MTVTSSSTRWMEKSQTGKGNQIRAPRPIVLLMKLQANSLKIQRRLMNMLPW